MNQRLASALPFLLLMLSCGRAAQAQGPAPVSIRLSAATYSVDETGGAATIRVMRTGSNVGGVTVQFTTTNGTATAPANYVDATQVLTFATGESFKDVPITVIDNALAEGNKTVVLTLSDPSPGAALGAIKTAVLTIRDNEPGLQFSAPVYVVNEATPTASVTVVRTGPTVGTVTVDYATAPPPPRQSPTIPPSAGLSPSALASPAGRSRCQSSTTPCSR
jgi:Calx-beta domain